MSTPTPTSTPPLTAGLGSVDGGLLSPAELSASVPGAVASLLNRIGSPQAAPAPSATRDTPTDFVDTEEDAKWFREKGEEDELPKWLIGSGAPPPRALYPGETSLDPAAWFDDDGECLADMPDWRSVRAAKEGRTAPPAPEPTTATLSPEATAAATAAAYAAFEAAAEAKAAKAREARLASDDAEEWDGQADETAYFDYDIDDDLPDWREARR